MQVTIGQKEPQEEFSLVLVPSLRIGRQSPSLIPKIPQSIPLLELAKLSNEILRLEGSPLEVFNLELILEVVDEIVDGCFVFEARNGGDKNIAALLHLEWIINHVDLIYYKNSWMLELNSHAEIYGYGFANN
jgi:hypothetical protein